ncbi:MAG: hypothetical protein KDA94_04215 [Acidimicrobiales bacterium]|nr:hypothetical protein [Acidimicrobiales bacterium]
MVAAVAVLAVGAGIAAIVVTRSAARERAAQTDPRQIELPDVSAEGGSETKDYLEGEGTALVELARDVELLLGTTESPTDEACQDAAEQLDGIGAPASLQQAVEAVPDEATRDLFQTYLGRSFDYVARCLAGEPSDADELVHAGTLVRRQLEQLEVR